MEDNLVQPQTFNLNEFQYTDDSGNRKTGLKFVNVEPDGNCYPRVISRLVYGTEDKHVDLRRDYVEFLKLNKDRYKYYLYTQSGLHHLEKDKLGTAIKKKYGDKLLYPFTPTVDDYFKWYTTEYINKLHTGWGGVLDNPMMAEFCGRSIQIVVDNRNSDKEYKFMYRNAIKSNWQPIIIYFNGTNHFGALIPTEWRNSSIGLGKKTLEKKDNDSFWKSFKINFREDQAFTLGWYYENKDKNTSTLDDANKNKLRLVEKKIIPNTKLLKNLREDVQKLHIRQQIVHSWIFLLLQKCYGDPDNSNIREWLSSELDTFKSISDLTILQEQIDLYFKIPENIKNNISDILRTSLDNPMQPDKYEELWNEINNVYKDLSIKEGVKKGSPEKDFNTLIAACKEKKAQKDPASAFSTVHIPSVKILSNPVVKVTKSVNRVTTDLKDKLRELCKETETEFTKSKDLGSVSEFTDLRKKAEEELEKNFGKYLKEADLNDKETKYHIELQLLWYMEEFAKRSGKPSLTNFADTRGENMYKKLPKSKSKFR